MCCFAGADHDGAMGVLLFHHPVIEQNPPHAHGGFMKALYILDAPISSGSATPSQFRVGDAQLDALDAESPPNSAAGSCDGSKQSTCRCRRGGAEGQRET
jgi:hypothetical protein